MSRPMMEPTIDPLAQARPASFIDRLAICISGLCVVHCIATLIFVTVLASAGTYFLADPRIHEYGLAIAIALASAALLRGVIRHRRLLPIALGGSGLLLMAAGLMVEHGIAEAVVTIAGVSLVASAHRLNTRAA
jgi:hypothetical protein